MVKVQLNDQDEVEGIDGTYADMLDRMADDEEAIAAIRNNVAQFVHAQFLRNVDDTTVLPHPYSQMLPYVDDDLFAQQFENYVHEAYQNWLENKREEDTE